jgi:hypothetical protein
VCADLGKLGFSAWQWRLGHFPALAAVLPARVESKSF